MDTKKKYELDIPEEVVVMMQRLQFDYNAKKDVIATLIATESDPAIFEGEVFMYYQSQMAQAQAELEIAKGEFEKAWLPEECKGKPYKWNLDFATNRLVVEPIGR